MVPEQGAGLGLVTIWWFDSKLFVRKNTSLIITIFPSQVPFSVLTALMWVQCVCKRFQPSTKRGAFLLKNRTNLATENTKPWGLHGHTITSLQAARLERCSHAGRTSPGKASGCGSGHHEASCRGEHRAHRCYGDLKLFFLIFSQVQSPCLTESCSVPTWSWGRGEKKQPQDPWRMEAASRSRVRCSPWWQVPHAMAISLAGNRPRSSCACYVFGNGLPCLRKYPAILAKDLAVQLQWARHDRDVLLQAIHGPNSSCTLRKTVTSSNCWGISRQVFVNQVGTIQVITILCALLCSSARAGGSEGQTLHCTVLGFSWNPLSLAVAGLYWYSLTCT